MPTFSDIQSSVADRMNLTSPQALTRIGLSINEGYRRLAALPWLQISRRGQVQAVSTVGLRTVTFTNTTKLYDVIDPTNPIPPLAEMMFDELQNQTPNAQPPLRYAIYGATADTVTIYLDCTVASSFALLADAELKMVTLVGNDAPRFNEDFHDILTYLALVIEYDKMEKPEMSTRMERLYQQRISDLKFHIAKTNYLDYQQGKDAPQAGLVPNRV